MHGRSHNPPAVRKRSKVGLFYFWTAGSVKEGCRWLSAIKVQSRCLSSVFITELCTLHHSEEHFKMKPETQAWFFTETKCYRQFTWRTIPALKPQLLTQEICEAICFSSSHYSKPRRQVKILHILIVISRWLLTCSCDFGGLFMLLHRWSLMPQHNVTGRDFLWYSGFSFL